MLGGAGFSQAVQIDMMHRIMTAAASAPSNWMRLRGPEAVGTCDKNAESIYCPINRVAYVADVVTSAGTYYVGKVF